MLSVNGVVDGVSGLTKAQSFSQAISSALIQCGSKALSTCLDLQHLRSQEPTTTVPLFPTSGLST
jgi:hypothetical protein